MRISPTKLKQRKVQFIVKELHNKFAFKCQKCSNCCSGTKLALYPFDIMNICGYLGITTDEFHKKYSYFTADSKGITRCLLRTNPVCALNDKKCTVYEARPVRCRMFPVGRMFKGGKVLYLLPSAGCAGFKSGKKQTIEEWISMMPNEMHKLSDEWSRFIIKLSKTKLPLDDKLFVMFFIKIFYDYDNELVQREIPDFKTLSTGERMKALYGLAQKYLFNFEQVKSALEKHGKLY